MSSINTQNQNNTTMFDKFRNAKNNYNNLGLAVIPLMPTSEHPEGKVPYCQEWHLKTANFDFDTTKCGNIGIVCGKNSGIVCIDVDVKDNGMKYFNRMIAKYYLPPCPTQITPNGGRHYIFKFNEKRMKNMKSLIRALSVNGNAVGVEIWIQNCQFVVEPSINHVNKKSYKWITPITDRDSIPELPEWIYAAYNYRNISEDGTIIEPKKESVDVSYKNAIVEPTKKQIMDAIAETKKNPAYISYKNAIVEPTKKPTERQIIDEYYKNAIVEQTKKPAYESYKNAIVEQTKKPAYESYKNAIVEQTKKPAYESYQNAIIDTSIISRNVDDDLQQPINLFCMNWSSIIPSIEMLGLSNYQTMKSTIQKMIAKLE